MSESNKNTWKMTTIGLLLVGVTALVTTVVMGNRSEPEKEKSPIASTPSGASVKKVSMPSQMDVDACNAYARDHAGSKGMEIAKDAAIGGLAGAGVGAAGGAIADGGSGAAKGAGIGGLVGIAGGALYGINENKKNDANYQAAYRSCLNKKGY